jgi:ATP-dependent DNA helicase RecQ
MKLTPEERNDYERRLKHKKEIDLKKLKLMTDYSEIESSCRRKYLLNYFGEEYTEENCGKCDICRGTYNGFKATGFNAIQEEIIYFIISHEGKIGKAKAIKILKGSYDLEPKYREWDDCGALKKENIKDIENEMNILIKRNIVEIKDGKYPVLKISSSGMNEIKKNNLYRKKKSGE